MEIITMLTIAVIFPLLVGGFFAKDENRDARWLEDHLEFAQVVKLLRQAFVGNTDDLPGAIAFLPHIADRVWSDIVASLQNEEFLRNVESNSAAAVKVCKDSLHDIGATNLGLFCILADEFRPGLGLRSARMLHRLDPRLVPRFETPFEIILASRNGEAKPTLRRHWRDTSKCPPWTTDPNHPMSSLNMKDVVWVDAAVDEVERVPARRLIERLADLGCPLDSLVQFIIPHTVEDRGYDSNLISDDYGLLGLDMIEIDLSESALIDLASKVEKIIASLEVQTDHVNQCLAFDEDSDILYLVRNLIQIRLVDAAILG